MEFFDIRKVSSCEGYQGDHAGLRSGQVPARHDHAIAIGEVSQDSGSHFVGILRLDVLPERMNVLFHRKSGKDSWPIWPNSRFSTWSKCSPSSSSILKEIGIPARDHASPGVRMHSRASHMMMPQGQGSGSEIRRLVGIVAQALHSPKVIRPQLICENPQSFVRSEKVDRIHFPNKFRQAVSEAILPIAQDDPVLRVRGLFHPELDP